MSAGTRTPDETSRHPRGYALGRNYPNPFNPRTVLRVTLPQKSSIVLTAADCLGKEVKILAEGEYPEGVHEIACEASGLPSGVFFYTLIVRDPENRVVFRETGKGLVLR